MVITNNPLMIPGVSPGCIVCVKNGERGFIDYQIRYTQRIALKDLDVGLSPADIRFFSEFTHIGVVTNFGIGEMWLPYARLRSWSKMDGAKLLIRRMPKVDNFHLAGISNACLRDVANHEKYGLRDLLSFYLRWRLKRKKKFVELFDDNDHDVCSTRAIEWHRQAGLWENIYDKWSYYPAHLACSSKWDDVVRVKIDASA